MLVVALVLSTQTVRIRRQAEDSAIREAHTETLYRLSRRLAGQTCVSDLTRIAAGYAQEVFHGSVAIFLPEDGKISFERCSSDRWPVSRTEEAVARWAFDHGEKAGHGMEMFGNSEAFYFPLKGAREMVGIVGVLPATASLSGPIKSARARALLIQRPPNRKKVHQIRLCSFPVRVTPLIRSDFGYNSSDDRR